jgi:hypothetical protein
MLQQGNAPRSTRRLSKAEWSQAKIAYASGLGLREFARNMGIPAGTVLARSKREQWTRQIAEARLIERPELARELARPDAINAISPMQSAAISLRERGQRHVEKMADLSERVLPVVEAMDADEVFDAVEKVDRYDRFARRQYGLDEQTGSGATTLNINILSDPNIREVRKIEAETREIEP